MGRRAVDSNNRKTMDRNDISDAEEILTCMTDHIYTIMSQTGRDNVIDGLRQIELCEENQ